MKKKQFCFYCGEDLGVYDSFGSRLETCGKRECEREASYEEQSERDQAAWDAQQDDYARYR